MRMRIGGVRVVWARRYLICLNGYRSAHNAGRGDECRRGRNAYSIQSPLIFVFSPSLSSFIADLSTWSMSTPKSTIEWQINHRSTIIFLNFLFELKRKYSIYQEICCGLNKPRYLNISQTYVSSFDKNIIVISFFRCSLYRILTYVLTAKQIHLAQKVVG